MSSLAISPSIDQGALLMFQDNFYQLAQQTDSRLVATKAIKFLPSNGKTNMMPRIGKLELVEVNTRNPDKQYSDYALDNRQFTKRRFTRTVTIDAKFDINELIKDPTSDILMQLNNAKERVIDRVAIERAVGAVLTGAPDATPVSTSAASDGVVTVSATAGLTYATIQTVTQNFINNDLYPAVQKGTTFCITGKEHAALMSEDKFINQFYINSSPVSEGVMKNTGMYALALFAGSATGTGTVTSAVLPEITSGTVRQCVVLAPESIAMAMEVGISEVARNPNKVNSFDVTIDLWINAMRTEGAKVQIVTTTI